MSNDRFKKYAEGAKKAVGPAYDSDEDLSDEERKKIKNAENMFQPDKADKLREEAWEKKDMYPKLKRSLKSMWYGDTRKK